MLRCFMSKGGNHIALAFVSIVNVKCFSKTPCCEAAHNHNVNTLMLSIMFTMFNSLVSHVSVLPLVN